MAGLLPSRRVKNSSRPEAEIAGAYSRYFEVLTCFMVAALLLSLTNAEPFQAAMTISAVCGPEEPNRLSTK